MTPFYLFAAQDPADAWLEAHPEVMAAILLVPATLVMLFGLLILLIPWMIMRNGRNKLPPVALIAIYSPGATFCLIACGMLLFAAYLALGGPSFR